MASFDTFSVEIDKATLDKVQTMLADVKNGAKQAIMRAANDTATTARSRIVDTVYSRLNLKKAEIRDSTGVAKAFLGNLTATAFILKKHIPNVKFPYLTSFVGVSVAVRKSQPSYVYRHMFVATMPSGHVGIFERKLNGAKPVGRLPIEETFGPKVGEVFHYNDEVTVYADLMTLFQKRVLERADYILSQTN